MTMEQIRVEALKIAVRNQPGQTVEGLVYHMKIIAELIETGYLSDDTQRRIARGY
jgi:hypothetical protein